MEPKTIAEIWRAQCPGCIADGDPKRGEFTEALMALLGAHHTDKFAASFMWTVDGSHHSMQVDALLWPIEETASSVVQRAFSEGYWAGKHRAQFEMRQAMGVSNDREDTANE